MKIMIGVYYIMEIFLKNTKINNDIKNFLLKINCPFNENMTFRQ